VFKAVPPTVIASASNVPSISASPEISSDVAITSPVTSIPVLFVCSFALPPCFKIAVPLVATIVSWLLVPILKTLSPLKPK